MKRAKRRTKYLLLLLILFISIGYAILQSNLNITGITGINNVKWDIHWDNLNVTDGSVSDANVTTPATIDTNKITVNYNITLSKPGDYYEFTVDAVNAGTIDGMIESISSKLNGTEITTLPTYLNYSVTYSDDQELLINQELKSGTTETYKVRVEYKKDISVSDLPGAEQTLNLSFSVTYKQANEDAIEVNHPYLYNVLRDAAVEGIYAREYTGEHHDSFTQEPTKKIYHWYGSNNDNGTAILDKNNVIFAGFCWQMIRTTDTGGVKIVYNGVPSSGQCNNSGIDQQIGTSVFNSSYNSPAYVGYMYNPNTLITYKGNSSATSGSLFGTGVTYSGGTYTLTNTSTAYDATHHYTCNNETGICSTIRYYYYNNNYTEINDGRTIEEALEDMLSADNVNQTNSTIKTAIDNWYSSNLTSYTSKLEDTIFCNDRSISNLGGWHPDGGSIATDLRFNNYGANSDLSCTNTTDKFSLANSKAWLTYPVGLLTYPEIYLLNNNNIRKTGQYYWLASPSNFVNNYVYGRNVYTSGVEVYSIVNDAHGVRPAVSLTPGTMYISGSGSKSDPYVVE